MSFWLYYTFAVLLLVNNVVGFLLNVAALPGNWLIVIGTAVFCWFVETDAHHVSWYVVILLLVLAMLGELLEFAAGTIGAAKSGASRRALVLSVVGSIAGSIVGAILGAPIPIVGSAVAAVLGGAIGAAAGAALGEDWNKRGLEGTMQIGAAAFWGRMLGTVGKVGVGAIMVVIATLDSFW